MADKSPEWGVSPTMVALQRLIDAASLAPIAVARRSEMSASELHALRHLSREPIGPAELARRLGVTTAATSAVIDRLVAHGHVARRPHPTDGRRTVLELTDEGRSEAHRQLGPMFLQLRALDASLDDHDRAVVDDFLERATVAIRSVM